MELQSTEVRHHSLSVGKLMGERHPLSLRKSGITMVPRGDTPSQR